MSNPFEVISNRLDGIEDLLLYLKHGDPKRRQEPEGLLTREEAADFLKIDPATLWRWTNKGKVKAYSIGSRRYYKRSELMEALTPIKQK